MAVEDYRTFAGQNVAAASADAARDEKLSSTGSSATLSTADYNEYAGLSTRTYVMQDTGPAYGHYTQQQKYNVVTSGMEWGRYKRKFDYIVNFSSLFNEVSVTPHSAGAPQTGTLQEFAASSGLRTMVMTVGGPLYGQWDPINVTPRIVVWFPASYILQTRFQGILNVPIMV